MTNWLIIACSFNVSIPVVLLEHGMNTLSALQQPINEKRKQVCFLFDGSRVIIMTSAQNKGAYWSMDTHSVVWFRRCQGYIVWQRKGPHRIDMSGNTRHAFALFRLFELYTKWQQIHCAPILSSAYDPYPWLCNFSVNFSHHQREFKNFSNTNVVKKSYEPISYFRSGQRWLSEHINVFAFLVCCKRVAAILRK